MAIVKKRRKAVVKLKEPPELNKDTEIRQQENNEVEATEMYKKNNESQNLCEKINDFKAVKSRENSKHKRTSNGAISIINSRSGKRLILAKALINKLSNPHKVVIGFSKDKLAIGKELPNNENYFTLRDSKGRAIIYSSDLVKEISEHFKLDFSDRTTITFSEVKYIEKEDNKVAIITIQKENGGIDE
ncbi:hypothetical protein RWZ02_15765 [Clostridium butyricum]|uniref:hypothetical protein n=1 Tax=Clostridium butyricum TaxID=1492 RepID=UPI0028FDBFE6|nr:hypothetical protein [Clostridium butyricum]MDU0324131.1 hypothetical protein [Clostridium butyricum]